MVCKSVGYGMFDMTRNGAMQKGHKQEKANMAVSGLYLLRANCMVAYHTLNVRSQQQGINFDWW